MYSYTYDATTGGILLNSSPTQFSKEPRPVYARELDLLGFNEYWKYEKQDDIPYMWAEANMYWYRGKFVAKLKGGNLYTAPEIVLAEENGKTVGPEPDGGELHPIDIAGMIEPNRELLGIIEQTTIKKILAIFDKYKDKLDLFHVAFSGGKDSMVLLDLVKKVLPKKSFVVVFGDTGMEFPDTYEAVRKTRLLCEKEGIPFYTAKSHLEPKDSWKLFGPPSRVLRWCCSVHKSTPQTVILRKITENNNFTGLDFVGVRSSESIPRSEYTYENYGKKQKGQYSHNSILEWTSAEIWLYIYANNLIINEAYKKGLARAGCLFCPMSPGTNDYMRKVNYTKEVNSFIEIIDNTYENNKRQKDIVISYIINGGWNARKNGRDLANNKFRCIERLDNGIFTIQVIDPKTEWIEWIKTIGSLNTNNEHYFIDYRGESISFILKYNANGYTVFIDEKILKDKPTLGKLFKQVFRKAAYCEGCRVCEINCKFNCIFFMKNKININNCKGCHECHNVDSGCLLFHSLRHPQGGGATMKSLNSFADHAPKKEWLQSYFELKDDFFQNHTLGPMMFDIFRRFLKDASLNEKNHFTPFAELISGIGWNSETAQGLVLINLAAENPQISWYIKNLGIGLAYERQKIEDTLVGLEIKPKDAKSIIKAYKRIVETPLGTILHFGYVTPEGDLVRTKCTVSDPRVLLYGLFKFAEKCGDYREFTLATLLNDNIEREGISPTRIFGLDREDMVPMLLGLSVKYPDFINATFTNDLEKITVKDGKTSENVLELFKGDGKNA